LRSQINDDDDDDDENGANKAKATGAKQPTSRIFALSPKLN